MTGPDFSGGRRGPFQPGDRVQLTDPRGRLNTITLQAKGTFHSHKGSFRHEQLLGQPEGIVITNTEGVEYLALRPLLSDYILSMPRGAQVVYPKDSGQIIAMADIFPGARVLESGVGSGGLTMPLLRAVGERGELHSIEIRPEFAEVARGNVRAFFGEVPPTWQLHTGAFADVAVQIAEPGSVDRVVLDMLAPWENVAAAAQVLRPGGVFCAYVATTTQMSRLAEDLRASQHFTEPSAFETMVRTWHLEGLAVRPDHRMVGHTGFLLIARRMADGVLPPQRKRRPAKGSYPSPVIAGSTRNPASTPPDIPASTSPVIAGSTRNPASTPPDIPASTSPVIPPHRFATQIAGDPVIAGSTRNPASTSPVIAGSTRNPASEEFTEAALEIRPVNARKLRRTIRELNKMTGQNDTDES